MDHYVCDGKHHASYSIICGDCEDLEKNVPKKPYSIVIVDIPFAYNCRGATNNESPYTYER